MADNFRVEIEGLEDLRSKMEKCAEDFPDQANLAMKRCAADWRKDVNAKMPSSYSTGKKPIPKNWKSEYTYNRYQVCDSVTIYNKAPHWHLVENGHRKFDFHGHDTGGFVPGGHYAADTNDEWEDKFPEEINNQLDKALAEAGFS